MSFAMFLLTSSFQVFNDFQSWLKLHLGMHLKENPKTRKYDSVLNCAPYPLTQQHSTLHFQAFQPPTWILSLKGKGKDNILSLQTQELHTA